MINLFRHFYARPMNWHEVRPGVFHAGKYRLVIGASDNVLIFINGALIGHETSVRRAKRHCDWAEHRANGGWPVKRPKLGK